MHECLACVHMVINLRVWPRGRLNLIPKNLNHENSILM